MDCDPVARKKTPLYSGVLALFPDALCAVARLSLAGSTKHNGAAPLHWAREKSSDHMDCLARHLLDYDRIDEGTQELHLAAVAWRALAQLQILEEQRRDTK